MMNEQEVVSNLLEGYSRSIKHLVRQPIKNHLKPKPRIDCLTYEQVLEYAAEKKLENHRIALTLLKVESSSPGKIVIVQLFADEEGELVTKAKGHLGRKLIARDLDAELIDIWDDTATTLTIDLSTI